MKTTISARCPECNVSIALRVPDDTPPQTWKIAHAGSLHFMTLSPSELPPELPNMMHAEYRGGIDPIGPELRWFLMTIACSALAIVGVWVMWR